MQRFAVFAYGTAVYCLFLAVFLYLIGFLTGFVVPRAINDPAIVALPFAVLVNVGLVSLFGIQHTIMARPRFKRWLTGLGFPAAAERSTFVLVTCLILMSMVVFWQPDTTVVWALETPVLYWAIYGIAALGWGTVLLSTFLINHFDLFGLRQVVLELRKRPYTEVVFVERWLYRAVRHPLLLGFLIAFWATPLMTLGHLTFALAFTTYIFIGIRFEERDLANHLGPEYAAYRKRTPMIVPRRPRPAATPEMEPAGHDYDEQITTVFLSETR